MTCIDKAKIFQVIQLVMEKKKQQKFPVTADSGTISFIHALN